MFDLGIVLKNLRTEAGYTQSHVARKLNVSTATVGRWENNYKMPSVERLIELSVLFNVPLNYLVGIEQEKAIVIDRLTKRQQDLLVTLILEFQNTKKGNAGLSDRQQDILNVLLMEFNSSV